MLGMGPTCRHASRPVTPVRGVTLQSDVRPVWLAQRSGRAARDPRRTPATRRRPTTPSRPLRAAACRPVVKGFATARRDWLIQPSSRRSSIGSPICVRLIENGSDFSADVPEFDQTAKKSYWGSTTIRSTRLSSTFGSIRSETTSMRSSTRGCRSGDRSDWPHRGHASAAGVPRRVKNPMPSRPSGSCATTSRVNTPQPPDGGGACAEIAAPDFTVL